MGTVRHWAIAALAAAALALAGCGGGSSSSPPDGGTVMEETAYDKAAKAITAAATAAAVDKAVADAEADVSVEEYKRLQTAAAARKTALATMARSEMQKQALMDAAGEVDTSDLSTEAMIDAAKAKIAKLQEAYDAAADVSAADKAMYKTSLDNANKAVRMQEQRNALSSASGKLDMALAAFSGATPTKPQLDAATAALRELKAALTGAEDLSATDKDRYQAQADRADADDGQIKMAQGHYHDHVVKNIEDTAIMAAMAAVRMVTDTSDESTVTAAQAAIDAAKAEIEGANIPADRKQGLLRLLAMHEGGLDQAEASRMAAKARMADEEEKQRVADAVKAITDTEIMAAMTAVGMVMDTSDESIVTAAQAAIDAAKAKIDAADIPEGEKAKLRTALAKHEGGLTEAKASRNEAKRIAGVVKMIEDGEIMTVMDAIEMITALSEESTVTDVEAAIAAAEKAITDANIPDANKEVLRAKLALQETAFGGAKMDRADGAKKGAALHAAMGPAKDAVDPKNALSNLQSTPYYIDSLVDSGNDVGTGEAIGRRGDFRIDPAEGAGAIPDDNVHKAVFFRHVGSEHIVDAEDDRFGAPHAVALPNVTKKGKYPKNFDTGDNGTVGTEWHVTDYTRTTGSGDGRVTDRVRVYNDRVGGPLYDARSANPIAKDLATYFATSEKPKNAGALDTDKRQLSLGTGVDRHLAAPAFDRSGAKSYALSDGASEEDPTLIKIPGTYMSAPGAYFCPSSGTCTVGVGVGGYFLSADWYFVYDEGAKVKEKDFDYLYFGWWIREDDEGVPAAVSAFYRSVGGGIELTTDGSSLQGVARYEGPAVGVYAIHDPLNEKGDGGDFTATAKLLAKFGATNLVPEAGMTGTIDGFHLDNGSEPNWSVTLQKGTWTTEAASRTVGSQKGHTDKTAKTVWSINGTPGTPAGSWVATLYDEAPGTIADGGDGNDRPSSVAGKFYAEHGGTHRMVGAFGAKIQLAE